MLCLTCMEKEDASYQTLEQLHERRKQVARLHKQGNKVMQIVKMVGLSYPTVRNVIDLFSKAAGLRYALQAEAGNQGKADCSVMNKSSELSALSSTNVLSS